MEQRKENATRTISVVMILTLVGKVMGLYRDHLLALHYGMGMEANVDGVPVKKKLIQSCQNL